jgi:hypothetical protein
MKVSVYDADVVHNDVNSLSLERQDALGSATFAIADAARDSSQPLTCTLLGASARGTVLVSAEEAVVYKKALAVSFCASSLANR